MGKKTVLLYIGGRTELDNRCRKILEELPPETNVNDFIKRAIVESIDGKSGLPLAPNGEIQLLRLEIQSIKKELQRMRKVSSRTAQPESQQTKAKEQANNQLELLEDVF